ncbi:MAG TPA: hypothetical protein VGZ47_12520 [Gemmataceae bacterium]|jgi:hypothetical protein|nr:hypothetical protein [Gemmataceae bacterium]
MLPDALPQLMDTLLRLPHLEAAQLRELIGHLPDPQVAAQEMVRRGWITHNQFSSLFPGPQQRPTPQETRLVGFGDGESPHDADCDDWSLPLTDDEDKADVAPEVKRPQPDRTDLEMLPEPETARAVPVLSGAASTPHFEGDVLVPPVAGGNEARRRKSDTDKLSGRWMGWASKGLLMCTLFLGSFFAGLQFFWANSRVPPVAHQESSQANAGNPARAIDLPPVPPIVPINNVKQPDDLPKSTGQNAQPAAPVAVPPVAAKAPVTAKGPAQANDAKPDRAASLYDRVRQVVLENKTEETERLGMGDIAYQDVPDDGSIMVGMAVTYAPFFTHQIIKSVRPIYQGPDGKRYDGPVCGTPTGVGERVVAKEGYAIGGAAIKAGMGIDGMQLTFMEIGADGLDPNKTYLSKWLGGYGGAGARTFVNDGRPIIGIAGMRSRNLNSPAFCLCLVTTRAGALADADPSRKSSPSTTRTER